MLSFYCVIFFFGLKENDLLYSQRPETAKPEPKPKPKVGSHFQLLLIRPELLAYGG